MQGKEPVVPNQSAQKRAGLKELRNLQMKQQDRTYPNSSTRCWLRITAVYPSHTLRHRERIPNTKTD